MKGKNARKNFTLPQRPSAWSEAINDVRKRLAEHRRDGARLRYALRLFEENAKRGEPWPGGAQKTA